MFAFIFITTSIFIIKLIIPISLFSTVINVSQTKKAISPDRIIGQVSLCTKVLRSDVIKVDVL